MLVGRMDGWLAGSGPYDEFAAECSGLAHREERDSFRKKDVLDLVVMRTSRRSRHQEKVKQCF